MMKVTGNIRADSCRRVYIIHLYKIRIIIKLKKPAIHEQAIKTVTPVISLILHSFVLSLELNYKNITQLPSYRHVNYSNLYK